MEDVTYFLMWCVAIGAVFTLAAGVEWVIGWLRDRVRWVKWFNWN